MKQLNTKEWYYNKYLTDGKDQNLLLERKIKKQEIVQSGPEEPKNLYIMGKRVKKKTKL